MTKYTAIILVLALIAAYGARKNMFKIALNTVGAKYKHIFARVENDYDLPKNLLAAVAYRESTFNANAVSWAGAVGIMQIIPKYHPGINVTDAETSIVYAGSYLRKLYNKFGTWSAALAAYNWGEGNLSKHGFINAPRETRDYVSNILDDIA